MDKKSFQYFAMLLASTWVNKLATSVSKSASSSSALCALARDSCEGLHFLEFQDHLLFCLPDMG